MITSGEFPPDAVWTPRDVQRLARDLHFARLEGRITQEQAARVETQLTLIRKRFPIPKRK